MLRRIPSEKFLFRRFSNGNNEALAGRQEYLWGGTGF
jgi:hypothetical protein